MSKIVVAGASGFIGQHLTTQLLARGHDVFALVRETSQLPAIYNQKDKTRLTIVRLKEKQEIPRETIQSSVAVINAVTAYGRTGDVAEQEQANIAWPERLLTAADDLGCPKFIQLDSFFAKPGLMHDYLPSYTDSKRRGEQTLRRVSKFRQIALVNARLEHVYGEGDRHDKFIPWLLSSLLSHVPHIRLTDGLQQRDFIHVNDVADAISLLIDAPPVTKEYQIGSGTAITLRQFCIEAHRLSHSRSTLDFGAIPNKSREIASSVAEIAPLLALGWRPQINLECGLASVVKDMRAQLGCLDAGKNA